MHLINDIPYKVVITADPVEVITVNKSLPFDCNALIIQNVGDVTVMINKEWTLRPNGVLSLGSQNDVNSFIGTLSFEFAAPATNTDVLRVECMVLQTDICRCKKTIC